jgi:hypothetical protein
VAAVALASLCLAIGFVTPAMSVIAAAAAVVDIAAGPHEQCFVVSLVLLLDAAALGLLRPGAYSIDAPLFGRRLTCSRGPIPTTERRVVRVRREA